MILDTLDNISSYYPSVTKLYDAMKIFEDNIFEEVGKYYYEWGYIMVQEGMTKHITDGYFETHKKYIDVQILKQGGEILSWLNINQVKNPMEYNTEKDVIHYTNDIMGNLITITPGTFYICFPQDAHKAVRHINEPMNYKKVVIKILI